MKRKCLDCNELMTAKSDSCYAHPPTGMARYRCMECGEAWWQKPGGVSCRCGSHIVEWVNYREWYEVNRAALERHLVGIGAKA